MDLCCARPAATAFSLVLAAPAALLLRRPGILLRFSHTGLTFPRRASNSTRQRPRGLDLPWGLQKPRLEMASSVQAQLLDPMGRWP